MFLGDNGNRVVVDGLMRRVTARVVVGILLPAALAACTTRSLQGIEGAADGPAIEHAVADCEARYQARSVTSYAAVAQCERDVALPEQQRQGPYLTGLYDVTWCNKIDLYQAVDAGRLTKPDADRQQAIDARNMITIVQSARRF